MLWNISSRKLPSSYDRRVSPPPVSTFCLFSGSVTHYIVPPKTRKIALFSWPEPLPLLKIILFQPCTLSPPTDKRLPSSFFPLPKFPCHSLCTCRMALPFPKTSPLFSSPKSEKTSLREPNNLWDTLRRPSLPSQIFYVKPYAPPLLWVTSTTSYWQASIVNNPHVGEELARYCSRGAPSLFCKAYGWTFGPSSLLPC